jgi:Universal stress protein family
VCIKQIKVLAKIYWGDPREKLCKAVENLKLDSLVVGNRGLCPLKRYILNTRTTLPLVSVYQSSPIPDKVHSNNNLQGSGYQYSIKQIE